MKKISCLSSRFTHIDLALVLTVFLSLNLAVICNARAEVPETGRRQELAFSSDAVNLRAESRYHEILADYAKKKILDDDKLTLQRVKRITSSLYMAAVVLSPKTVNWHWEIHTTSDPGVEAYCMAGGKLLVGSKFVNALRLSDGELATLIGHEMAHAVAEHHRETFSEALLINPHPSNTLDRIMVRMDMDLSLQLKLSNLSNLQEAEADRLGMLLAKKAGWASADMVSFFKKLSKAEAAPSLNNSHPSSSSRLDMARQLAATFSR
ncbi:MAG: M48 family metalloprotease [Pseudomonadota bacterium]